MSVPAYPEYKDSGVPWLGNVPSHWERSPLFALVRELDESNTGMKENNLLSLSYGRIKRKNIDNNDGLLPASFETYQIVENEDIIWRLTDLQNDQRSLRTGIVRERGIITSAYLATRPIGVQPEFLAYLLRAYDLTKVFYSMGGGLRQSMKFSDVKWLPVMLPSLKEQAAIAAFLDRETIKIDALVAEQERLIALLTEKRQAVISHAVTKGLNPDAPMKDSGIEWLGDIPSHWTVTRLSNLYREAVREGSDELPILSVSIHHGVSDGEIPDEEMDRMVARSDDRSKYKRVQPNDLVYNMMRAWQGGFGTVRAHGQVSPAYVVAEPVSNLKSDFVEAVLRTSNAVEQMRRHSRGVTDFRLRLYWDQFKNLEIGIPPADEINEILARCQALVQQHDSLARAARKSIELLQERRAALISAAVTGKIDVRGAFSPSNVIPIDTARTSAANAKLRACVGALSICALGSMGRMAVMKGAYLAEGYAGISELGGTYQREAAGPFCRAVIDGVEREATQAFGIQVIQPEKEGERVTYGVPSDFVSPASNLRDMLGEDRTKRLVSLFYLLKDLNRDGVEAIATLFAVWNDLIASGHSADDNAVIRGVLEDWHPEKAVKFNRDNLARWLAWMRRNQIVPNGSAPRTDHQGSLFQ